MEKPGLYKRYSFNTNNLSLVELTLNYEIYTDLLRLFWGILSSRF
jgi:hypothetical protein